MNKAHKIPQWELEQAIKLTTTTSFKLPWFDFITENKIQLKMLFIYSFIIVFPL